MKDSVKGKLVISLTGVGLLITASCITAVFTLLTVLSGPGTDADAGVSDAKHLTVECNLVETHTIEYIEETITETEYVDVVRTAPVKLRNFEDLEELERWLRGRNNNTTVRFQQADMVLDCDDYALEMQRKALEDGYIMSFEIIGRSEYNELFKNTLPPGQSLHAINLAIIDNSVYYIEPQTDEIILAAYMD